VMERSILPCAEDQDFLHVRSDVAFSRVQTRCLQHIYMDIRITNAGKTSQNNSLSQYENVEERHAEGPDREDGTVIAGAS
jgi:hypothetical protein